MKKQNQYAARLIASILLLAAGGAVMADTNSHDALVQLFADWREFENPPLLDGAPDYTAATFAARQPEYLELRDRLDAFDISDWPVPQQVDWHLVRAEMNGYDFNRRVLQPWVRDPAFYATIWSAGTRRADASRGNRGVDL
jgi:hypothetical protein